MGHSHRDVEKQSHDLANAATLDEDLSTAASWLAILQYAVIGHLGLVIVLLYVWVPSSVLLEVSLATVFKQQAPPFLAHSHGTGRYAKPTGLEIVAVVPVRNHSRSEILHHHLMRNLVQNHGFVDHVVWIPEIPATTAIDVDNLQWVTKVVEQYPAYSVFDAGNRTDTHQQPWDLFQPGVLYLHIDGDIIFLEDHTIPTVIKTKLDYPQSIMVSANVINENPVARLYNRLDSTAAREESSKTATTAQLQVHESFLAHLHQGQETLRDYKFPIWVNPPDPVRPVFVAFWGDDVQNVWDYNYDKTSENMSISKSTASSYGRGHERVIIDGKGLAAHYRAEAGIAGLDATDILERYRAYAQLRTGAGLDPP